jgi:hypothetical protein
LDWLDPDPDLSGFIDPVKTGSSPDPNTVFDVDFWRAFKLLGTGTLTHGL